MDCIKIDVCVCFLRGTKVGFPKKLGSGIYCWYAEARTEDKLFARVYMSTDILPLCRKFN